MSDTVKNFGINLLKRNVLASKLNDASDSVKQFCYNELKKIGITNPTKEVCIKEGSQKLNFDAAFRNCKTHQGGIILSKISCRVIEYVNCNEKQEKEMLKNLYNEVASIQQAPLPKNYKQTLMQNKEKMRGKIKFIVQHEGGHVKNQDIPKYMTSSLIIPFSVYLFPKLFMPLFMKNQYDKKYSWYRKLGYSLAVSFVKTCTSFGIFSAYSKKHEQMADNGTENNPEILQGGIDFLNDVLISSQGKDAFTLTHPRIKTRINKLQERLDTLQNKQV